MPTQATFYKVSKIDGALLFMVGNGICWIALKSLEKGTACIDAFTKVSLSDFIDIVVGFFDEKSNFYGFHKIKFEWTGIEVEVSPHDTAANVKGRYRTAYFEKYNRECEDIVF